MHRRSDMILSETLATWKKEITFALHNQVE